MDKNRTKTKLTLPQLGPAALRESASGVGWALFAFLLGQAQLPFGASPLGLALLCAARGKILWLLGGLCASAFTREEGILVRVCAYLFAVGVRIAVRMTLDPPLAAANGEKKSIADRFRAARPVLFGETLMLRMATACVSAFLVGVHAIVQGGYRYYDLFGALLGMAAAPLCCLLYAAFFEPTARGSLAWEAAAGGLLVSLVWSVREVSLFGISISAFLAFTLTLMVTRQRGLARGALLGSLCGLAVAPLYAPLFLIAAGVSGLLWPRSSTAAVTVSCLLGVLWGGYAGGLASLVELVPALVCASIFVLSGDKLSLFPEGTLFGALQQAKDSGQAEQAVAAQRAASAEARMQALSDTFSALSQVCYNLSDRLRRPGVLELRRLCDETCDRYCLHCTNSALCWEREYGSTLDVLGKLTIELHGAGRASSETVPEYLRRRCPSMPAILEDINRGCARLYADTADRDRTELFAVDYEAVSAILAETLAAEQADYAVDEELTGRVRSLASRLGLRAQGILAYGGRRKQILAQGLDLTRAGIGVEDLRRSFVEACGFALTAPVFEIKDDLVSMRLCAARRYRVEYVQRSVSAAGEACGDSLSLFESGEMDCFYALISDGMGSGREAALTSRICTLFLEKMLGSGNRKETALRLLNSFVRSKGLECSSTIDLMELDLLCGRASFIKSGAAPSYVRRDGNLFKLQSKTVPIGIMRALDAEQLVFDVEAGDVIVMLSDGIAQSFEESVWLLDLLSCGWEEGDSLDAVADKILAGAAAANARPDDRTVALIRVCGVE